MPGVRRVIRTMAALLAAGSATMLHSVALAAPVLAQSAGAIKVNQTGGKHYAVEALVTVAFLALGLFVVCRSSRRV